MKSIFKSMSCLVFGRNDCYVDVCAQKKKLYPELEGPGPVVIISKDKNGKEELINVFEETHVRISMIPVLLVFYLLTNRESLHWVSVVI